MTIGDLTTKDTKSTKDGNALVSLVSLVVESSRRLSFRASSRR